MATESLFNDFAARSFVITSRVPVEHAREPRGGGGGGYGRDRGPPPRRRGGGARDR